MSDNGFYDSWGDDYMQGYDMTEEEWEELHMPYSECDDWKYEDE